jgi:chromosome segregation ATPase
MPDDTTTPVEDLDLTELQNELDANQRDAARLKSLIADVKKTVDTIEQKKKDLEKSAASNEQAKEEFTQYVHQEKSMLEPVIDAPAVQHQHDTAVTALNGLRDAIGTAEGGVAQADVDLLNAQAATEAAQKAFDDLAGRPANNADLLKDLAALRAAADKQGSGNLLSHQYFLLLVMEDRLGALTLDDPNAYAAALKQAGVALATAKDKEHTAESEMDAAKAALTQARKTYQDAKAKFVATELAKVIEGTAPPS